jgi:hypothetical protein
MKFIDFFFAKKPLFPILIAIVLAAFVIKIHGNRLFDKKRKYHPVAGTILHQLLNFHRLLEYMTDLTNKRKTYRLLSFTRSEVYTSNPANIEHILVTNFSNYGKVLFKLSVAIKHKRMYKTAHCQNILIYCRVGITTVSWKIRENQQAINSRLSY